MVKVKSQYYINRTIKSLKIVSKIFPLFAMFYMTIFTQIALKPYIETLISKISKHWYWQSSYRDSSHWNNDIKIIEHPNNIEPISLKFHIEPALDREPFIAFCKTQSFEIVILSYPQSWTWPLIQPCHWR